MASARDVEGLIGDILAVVSSSEACGANSTDVEHFISGCELVSSVGFFFGVIFIEERDGDGDTGGDRGGDDDVDVSSLVSKTTSIILN